MREVKMMFRWMDFALATTAVVTLIVCYVLIFAKLKPSDESSENKVFSPTPQESNEDISRQRRIEMLERIKEEKIKEYYDRKKRKTKDS